MPIPTFTGLPPHPEFADIVKKVNTIVQELTNMMLNLDSLNVVSLTADHVDTGTLDAGKVTVRADLDGGAYIQIDTVNGLVISNGTNTTFTADINGNVTMTSATIQSASGYPKIEMNPSTNLFRAYLDANNYIEIDPDYAGSPSINIVESGTVRGQIVSQGGKLKISGTSGLLVETASGNIALNPATIGGRVDLGAWARLFNTSSGQTLQDALNAKANAFSGITGTVYVATTSGGPATTAITFTNGVRVS